MKEPILAEVRTDDTYIPDPTLEVASEDESSETSTESTEPTGEINAEIRYETTSEADETPEANSSVTAYSGRLDSYTSASDIRNPFLRAFLREIKNGELSVDVKVTTSVVRSRKCPGFWEEGGYDDTYGGRVLLVTGPKGEKLDPVKAYISHDVTNGQHALLAVDKGYHLILGGLVNKVIYFADYVITDITPYNDTYKATLKCVGYYCQVGDNVLEAVQLDPCEQSELKLGMNHKVMDIAVNRITAANARKPAYVNEYVSHRFFLSDYVQFISRPHFMEECESHETLEDAYAKVSKVTGQLYDQIKKTGNQVILTTSVNYAKSHNVIVVYLLIGLYDAANGQCYIPVEAHSVQLPSGSDVYYINNVSNVVSWDKAVEILSKPNVGGCMASSLRRVIGDIDE